MTDQTVLTDPVPVPSTAAADPATGPSRLPRWLRHPSRRGLVGVGALVVVGVLLATRVVGGASSAGYRTAEVSEHDVDQVLEAVATIEPVEQASVSFPVAGTVASVEVAVGDRVETGDVLAALDDTDLQRDLVDAQAALAEAELTLEKALNGESVTPSGDTGAGGDAAGTALPTSTSSTGTSSNGAVELGEVELVAYATQAAGEVTGSAESTASSSVTDADVAAAQQAVLTAQQQVDADTAAAQAALDNAAAVCGTVDPTTGTVDAAACQAALDSALTAQQALAADQAALSQAMDAYDALLDERANEVPATTTTTAPSSGTGSSGGAPAGTDSGAVSGGSTGFSGAAGGTSSSSSPSAADLVAYQRDVDKAALGVLVAQQAVRQATIVAPFGGTVAAVDLAAGDEVEAESDTAAVVIRGTGGYEVTTFVAVDGLADLELGQAATVLPDGADEALDGEIVRIGVVADDGSYPVTIGLTDDGHGAGLGNGATATVRIVTAAADQVLAVPTSAVTVDGDRSTVTVLDGGEPTEVEVEVGAVGDPWTEVTDGLTEGQQVVLADLDEPLPGSATDTSSSGSSGGPSFGGGSFPGGGPPGFGGGG